MNEPRRGVEEGSGGADRVLGCIELSERREVEIGRQGCEIIGVNVECG